MNAIDFWLAVLLSAALAECSGDSPREARDSGHENDDRHGGDAPRGSDADGSSSDELALRVEATADEVCPGECVTLTASVSGVVSSGEGYAFSWADAADARGSTREVCPRYSPLATSKRPTSELTRPVDAATLREIAVDCDARVDDRRTRFTRRLKNQAGVPLMLIVEARHE